MLTFLVKLYASQHSAISVGVTFRDSDNAITTNENIQKQNEYELHVHVIESQRMDLRRKNYIKHRTKDGHIEHLHLLKTSSSIFISPADRNEFRTSSRSPVCARALVVDAIVVCNYRTDSANDGRYAELRVLNVAMEQ